MWLKLYAKLLILGDCGGVTLKLKVLVGMRKMRAYIVLYVLLSS